METFKAIAHWAAYAYYLYVFGYASLFKVFKKTSMVDSMQTLGFDLRWTLIIGYAELLGVIALIAGLWKHELKNAAVLWLFPFAVGALIAHFAHHDYQYYGNALAMCVLSVMLLATDKYFRIAL
jgi:glucan phosphoethanolaminetransferase (alkaline phosphatase superfamily)